ncbi:hypothetical protein VNO78_27264 [Psophocarpus tetragonolobus]|uniref:SANTA domain-containing protein n=1 Tax=Psophocarpus tetragonolobus TaxID=3891 RepID=A0AAN9S104_PSOTE
MAQSKCNSATPLVPVPPKSLIFLHEWWLVKQRKGLALGGVASIEGDRERVFLSSVIAEREEANVLHTEDGITILFRGSINPSRSSQSGVPLEVCEHFSFGFPHDWKKYSDNKGFGDSNERQGISFEQSESVNAEKGQDSMGMHDSRKPPISTEKMESDRSEKKQQKSASSCRVTRSISKSNKKPKYDEKVPVRRSPRFI